MDKSYWRAVSIPGGVMGKKAKIATMIEALGGNRARRALGRRRSRTKLINRCPIPLRVLGYVDTGRP